VVRRRLSKHLAVARFGLVGLAPTSYDVGAFTSHYGVVCRSIYRRALSVKMVLDAALPSGFRGSNLR